MERKGVLPSLGGRARQPRPPCRDGGRASRLRAGRVRRPGAARRRRRPRAPRTRRSPSAWPSARCSGAARWTGSSPATSTAASTRRSAPRCSSASTSCSTPTCPQHAAVAESVELAKPNPGAKLVNAVLRKVQREGGVELPSDDNPKGAAIRHSHPEWLTLLWWDWLGADETRALLAADNEPAELALRINPLAGVEVDLPGRREDDALVVEGPLDVLAHPLYAAGAITPQSRASQRVARAVDPQPGERVLDLCAAPGGKTTHLAALMGDRGEIVAVERHPQRAEALAAQAQRMRATSVRVHVGDAARRHARGARRALRPRPRRPAVQRPGHAAHAPRPALARHARGHRGAARRAGGDRRRRPRRAGPGGRLVYSTCTISPREEVVGGRGRPHAPAPRRHRRLLYCRRRWQAAVKELGAQVPRLRRAVAAADDARRPLPLRLLPAPLRAALGLPGLRRALHDRAHVLHRHHRLQPLRRLDAGRGLSAVPEPRIAPSILAADFAPPGRAGARGRRRRRAASSTSTSWTATSSRRCRWARRSSARCATSTSASTYDVHLMVERPERHVADFAKAGAHNITVHAEATPHVHYAVQRDPRARLHRRRRGLPVDAAGRLRASSTSTSPSA